MLVGRKDSPTLSDRTLSIAGAALNDILGGF